LLQSRLSGWLVGEWASAHQFLGSRVLSLLAGHERTSQTRSGRIAGDLEDQLTSGVDKVAALSAVMTKASGPPITRSRRPRSDHSRSAVPSGCGRHASLSIVIPTAVTSSRAAADLFEVPADYREEPMPAPR
jgi:hypothetical protein